MIAHKKGIKGFVTAFYIDQGKKVEGRGGFLLVGKGEDEWGSLKKERGRCTTSKAKKGGNGRSEFEMSIRGGKRALILGLKGKLF